MRSRHLPCIFFKPSQPSVNALAPLTKRTRLLVNCLLKPGNTSARKSTKVPGEKLSMGRLRKLMPVALNFRLAVHCQCMQSCFEELRGSSPGHGIAMTRGVDRCYQEQIQYPQMSHV